MLPDLTTIVRETLHFGVRLKLIEGKRPGSVNSPHLEILPAPSGLCVSYSYKSFPNWRGRPLIHEQCTPPLQGSDDDTRGSVKCGEWIPVHPS